MQPFEEREQTRLSVHASVQQSEQVASLAHAGLSSARISPLPEYAYRAAILVSVLLLLWTVG